jgi:protein TonB
MDTIIRPGLLPLFVLLAGLGGCANVRHVASDASSHITSSIGLTRPAPAVPPSVLPTLALDDYKTEVARHVCKHNPEHRYSGTLPPLLPAIVVLEITVDRDGRMTDVAVQRSRNAAASQVALESVRRSAPLPRPRGPGNVTFSETFLFADQQRYQLRSLAGPQASE